MTGRDGGRPVRPFVGGFCQIRVLRRIIVVQLYIELAKLYTAIRCGLGHAQ